MSRQLAGIWQGTTTEDGALGFRLTRIGLEAGPLSQWLYAGPKAAGLAVELLETRHVRNAFKAMPVKPDRKDAHGIAQLLRLGWFRPVHCKSELAQETRALLTARKLIEVEYSLCACGAGNRKSLSSASFKAEQRHTPRKLRFAA